MLTNNIKLRKTKRVYIFVFFSVMHILIDIYISTPEPNRISVSNYPYTMYRIPFYLIIPSRNSKRILKRNSKVDTFSPIGCTRSCKFIYTDCSLVLFRSVVIALLCITRRWFMGEDRSPWDGPSHVSWQAETVQAVFHFQKTKGNREDGVFDT
jgi:hypothetical protein